MVKRHTTLPFNFFCFTEDATNINPEINIMTLPPVQLSGWWLKPYVFKQGLFPVGTVNMFVDLDMVIVNNLDKLLTYMPGEFIGLEDVSRVFRQGREKLGSAVLRWCADTYTDVWSNLEQDISLSKRFRGDQDYLWVYYKDQIKFFPTLWIQSYKWEIRNRSELIKIGDRWNFKDVRNTVIHPDVAVLAFHGSPDPHEVQDPVIVNNWQ